MSTLSKSKRKIPYIYLEWEHNGWGNSIQSIDWDQGKIVGWLSRIPEVNDRLIFKTKSGKLGETKFVSVEKCGDPRDMFFAKIETVDYITQDELDKKLAEQKKNEPKYRFL